MLRLTPEMETFSGWQLPARYTDPFRELEDVRASAGISDASYLFKLTSAAGAPNSPYPRGCGSLPRHDR